MKNIKDKFKKRINFVKPLYKKVNPKPNELSKSEFVSVDIDNREKLCGDGDVKNTVDKGKCDTINVYHKNYTEKFNIVHPRTCQREVKAVFSTRGNRIVKNMEEERLSKISAKILGVVENDNSVVLNKITETWLRMYPAPFLRNESTCSIIFRCFACQMGLSTFLLIWTIMWVLIIQHLEGPFEKKVSEDFKHSQNQLVIDLATELRQITPISPKWRDSIEKRIEEERKLTIAAVVQGARLSPGYFWDMAGTFLFTIYVMTALGFGAPVPQTLCGRTTALIYAIVAVPTHLYLLIHLSTCVVFNVECCMERLRLSLRDRRLISFGQAIHNKTESPNCSRNSELKPNICKLRRRIICILRVLCVGRGVPLAMILYYVLGLTTFGIARSKQPLEVVMFPLEFTTTGGLEHVESYVRLIYGIYVEGAMILLSCALTTLRRHSTGSVTNIADRYKLYAHGHHNQ